jgi:hypothetical protein
LELLLTFLLNFLTYLSPELAQRNRQVGELKVENKKAVDNYNKLSDKYNRLVGAVNQLPAEEIEFIKNIVEPPPAPNERRRSRDDYER